MVNTMILLAGMGYPFPIWCHIKNQKCLPCWPHKFTLFYGVCIAHVYTCIKFSVLCLVFTQFKPKLTLIKKFNSNSTFSKGMGIMYNFYTTAKNLWSYYVMALWLSASSFCGHKGFRNLSFDGVDRFFWYFDTLIPSMRYGVGLMLGVPAPPVFYEGPKGAF